MRSLIICLMLLQLSCASSVPQTTIQQTKPERRLMERSSRPIKFSGPYLKRETGKGKEYDPQPHVVLIDEKKGIYEFRWIGYDGKQKVIKYERADMLDVLVEAQVEKNQTEGFIYSYTLKNLPSSPTSLSTFNVQTLSEDSKHIKMRGIFTGVMDNRIKVFSEGKWLDFAILPDQLPYVEPGNTIKFQLSSKGLPGLVNCRAMSGDSTIKGVGEEMPTELEKAMGGYEEMVKGYTIGPIDRLSQLTKPERANYFIENLEKFQEAGWMTEGTAKKYEKMLKNNDLIAAFEESKKDLKNEFIAPEIFYVLEGLSH